MPILNPVEASATTTDLAFSFAKLFVDLFKALFVSRAA